MIIDSRFRQRAINLWLKVADLKWRDDVFIARGSIVVSDLTIGHGTRFNGRTFMRGSGRVAVGRYCAVADSSRFITSNHGMSGPNLQYALQRTIGATSAVSDKNGIAVGHNVWLGDDVTILPGVSIASGAVIGAGAIVTRDVGAYEVCAGNPARKIGERFAEAVMDALDELAWWDWSLTRMRKAPTFFESDLAAMDPKEAVAFIQSFRSDGQN